MLGDSLSTTYAQVVIEGRVATKAIRGAFLCYSYIKNPSLSVLVMRPKCGLAGILNAG